MKKVATPSWKDTLDLERWEDTDMEVHGDAPSSGMELEGCKPPAAFHLDLRVHRSGLPGAYEFQLDGSVTGDLGLTCVRCLAETPFRLEVPFSVRYLPISALPLDEEGEAEVMEKDVDIEYYRRPVFDLLALVREQVYLGVPMDPVCRADCAGLCPRCGADRNLGPHACTEKAVDPRWEALEALKTPREQRTGKKRPN
ncbi:MAG: DUF177 domain-containing protein [Acidobacteriota bacterium]